MVTLGTTPYSRGSQAQGPGLVEALDAGLGQDGEVGIEKGLQALLIPAGELEADKWLLPHA